MRSMVEGACTSHAAGVAAHALPPPSRRSPFPLRGAGLKRISAMVAASGLLLSNPHHEEKAAANLAPSGTHRPCRACIPRARPCLRHLAPRHRARRRPARSGDRPRAFGDRRKRHGGRRGAIAARSVPIFSRAAAMRSTPRWPRHSRSRSPIRTPAISAAAVSWWSMRRRRGKSQDSPSTITRPRRPRSTTSRSLIDGDADPQKSRELALAIGVPGTVAGLALAEQKSRLGQVHPRRLDHARDRARARWHRRLRRPANSLPIDGLFSSAGRRRRGSFFAPTARRPRGRPSRAARSRRHAGRDRGRRAAFYQGRIAEDPRSRASRRRGDDGRRYYTLSRGRASPVRGNYRGYDITRCRRPRPAGCSDRDPEYSWRATIWCTTTKRRRCF